MSRLEIGIVAVDVGEIAVEGRSGGAHFGLSRYVPVIFEVDQIFIVITGVATVPGGQSCGEGIISSCTLELLQYLIATQRTRSR